MLEKLFIYNFPSGTAVPQLPAAVFHMATCQRTMVMAWGEELLVPLALLSHPPLVYQGREGYLFLLETICGLQSRLVGENEIVGQFKTAYQEYATRAERCNQLLHIIEKLFKDSKEIRGRYLMGLAQKTYASLTRRQFIQRYRADRILILGSGQLAEDLINQFKKKAKVVLCARNAERAQELARQHGLELLPWDQRHSSWNFAFIANTIGCHKTIWGPEYFDLWDTTHTGSRLFIDLGSPSTIQTSLGKAEFVWRLNDIFHEGAIEEDKKREQIEKARAAMSELVEKRAHLFRQRALAEGELELA